VVEEMGWRGRWEEVRVGLGEGVATALFVVFGNVGCEVY